MKIIELSSGYFAKVCDCHHSLVKDIRWHYTHGYARCNKTKSYGRSYMHKLICDAPQGLEVDHINEDKLDNRCTNLRAVPRRVNVLNRGTQKNNTSGYRGVTWSKNDKKWVACVKLYGRRIHLGYFDTREKAATAYNEAASVHYGELARLNTL